MKPSHNISVKVGARTFSLKNIEVFESLSDETTAFTADVYVGKTKVGTCENSGKGEGNYPCIYDASDRALMENIEKEVGKHCCYIDDGLGHVIDLDYDLDLLIALMVDCAWVQGRKTYRFEDEN